MVTLTADVNEAEDDLLLELDDKEDDVFALGDKEMQMAQALSVGYDRRSDKEIQRERETHASQRVKVCVFV